MPAKARLEASGSFNSMVSHRVRIEKATEIDQQLVSWLKQAKILNGSGETAFARRRFMMRRIVDLERVLRRHVYTMTLGQGVPPTIAELAASASLSVSDARDGLERLAAGRVLVLQPESGEILMAPPFSAVPTPFVVTTSRYDAYANCAWDALGVPVMLHQPARVTTGCACCGEAITLEVSLDGPPGSGEVVHFAVPAARWWHDIVFT